ASPEEADLRLQPVEEPVRVEEVLPPGQDALARPAGGSRRRRGSARVRLGGLLRRAGPRPEEQPAGPGEIDELAHLRGGKRLAEALLERPADGLGVALAVELGQQERLLLTEGEEGAGAEVLDHVAAAGPQRPDHQVRPPRRWDGG